MEKFEGVQPTNEVTFEQTDEGLQLSLPDGQDFVVDGVFKGPFLDSYEGTTESGTHVHVLFAKEQDGSLGSVIRVEHDGATVFGQNFSEAA